MPCYISPQPQDALDVLAKNAELLNVWNGIVLYHGIALSYYVSTDQIIMQYNQVPLYVVAPISDYQTTTSTQPRLGMYVCM